MSWAPTKNILLSQSVLAGFAVALLILVSIGVIAYGQSRVLQSDAEQIDIAVALIKNLDQLNIRLIDAETGQRGYLITGEDKYLEPYNAALSQIPILTESVSRLVSDNSEETAHVDTVRALTAKKLAELNETIGLRRTVGFEAARTVVLTDLGKNTMDQIRLNLAEIIRFQEGQINEKLANERKQANLIFMITVVGNLLAFLTVLLATFIMGRNLLHHDEAKAALLASEERFHLIADATNDVIWDWNLVSDNLWWNKGVEDVFGYGKNDVGHVGKWLTDRIHPDDRKAVTDSIEVAIAEDQSTWFSEYRFKKSDGKYAAVLDRGSIQYDAFGRGVRMVSSMQDVSERERAEKKRSVRNQELERMNGLMVDRELMMRELKKEIADLRMQAAL